MGVSPLVFRATPGFREVKITSPARKSQTSVRNGNFSIIIINFTYINSDFYSTVIHSSEMLQNRSYNKYKYMIYIIKYINIYFENYLCYGPTLVCMVHFFVREL